MGSKRKRLNFDVTEDYLGDIEIIKKHTGYLETAAAVRYAIGQTALRIRSRNEYSAEVIRKAEREKTK